MPLTTLSRLDFWVNSSLNWMFELVRGGAELDEHVSRFLEHGSYFGLRPQQWRVVDFRSKAPQPGERKPNLVIVHMCADGAAADVYCGAHDKTPTRISFDDARRIGAQQ